MVAGFQTDLYRVPLVIEPSTFTFAAIVVLASALVSALLIQLKINHLNLVEVLKTKE
jgi:putative ABC transport system permease protein